MNGFGWLMIEAGAEFARREFRWTGWFWRLVYFGENRLKAHSGSNQGIWIGRIHHFKSRFESLVLIFSEIWDY